MQIGSNMGCSQHPPSSSAHSALFGSGFDSDEELPLAFPLSSSISRPAYSLPDSDGYFSHGTLHPQHPFKHLCVALSGNM